MKRFSALALLASFAAAPGVVRASEVYHIQASNTTKNKVWITLYKTDPFGGRHIVTSAWLYSSWSYGVGYGPTYYLRAEVLSEAGHRIFDTTVEYDKRSGPMYLMHGEGNHFYWK